MINLRVVAQIETASGKDDTINRLCYFHDSRKYRSQFSATQLYLVSNKEAQKITGPQNHLYVFACLNLQTT